MTDYLTLTFWILLTLTIVVSVVLVIVAVLLWRQEVSNPRIHKAARYPDEVNWLLSPDERLS